MTKLQNFRLARYRVILTAHSPISMPPYAGSTLRGGFGHAFRKLVCTQGPIDCRDCTLKAVCPYPYIFETAPFEGAQQLRTYGDVPRPFVIDPLETRGEYRRGESFAFRLTLIGRAIDYLPYFLVSFRELGEIGIGKGRGLFQLTQVIADQEGFIFPQSNPPAKGGKQGGKPPFAFPPCQGGQSLNPDGESIYDGDTQMVHNLDNALSFDDIRREAESLPTNQLTVRLLTPTRVTHEGQITDKLPFHVFWRRLIGRISALAYFHCGESLEMDFKGLIEKATTVETTNSTLRWKDWTRYSSRQNRKMKLGGLIGSVDYAGDLAVFIPFVALGAFLHVGKNATFGLGKYRLDRSWM